MTRRIIQFSTGNVGVHALRTIIERPDLEPDVDGGHRNSVATSVRDWTLGTRRGLATTSGHVFVELVWHR
jgi:hypothetical protein